MGTFVSIQRRLGCVGFIPRVLSLGDQGVQVIHNKGRVCLACGPEISFRANVKLHVFRLEPGAAAFGKFGRFWNFGEAQNFDKEGSRFCFFAYGHGKLNVVNG